MQSIKLVIFDMAGTTVQDLNEVEKCFFKAMDSTGLTASRDEVNAMMGWSKIKVFETLWERQIGAGHREFQNHVQHSYHTFTDLLEQHYNEVPVHPITGILEVFRQLRENQIKIALTTGFYRKVTNIILKRLGWDKDLDDSYLAVRGGDPIIDCSVSSSEVDEGRPAPDMIRLVMQKLGIHDTKEVINIGDTPSDILSGRSAGVAFTVGVGYGTHTADELKLYKPDRLINNASELIELILTKSDTISSNTH